VALLFGSEKTGLTNEQLSHCQLLVNIPMFAPSDARHLSMNLGQAVAVCLYELGRGGFEDARDLPAVPGAEITADARERLTQLLLDAMEATDYSRRFPANAREHVVRQLAMQLGRTQDEAITWMGFLRQVVRGAKKDAPG
jgi:tRNA/rRNA methyltransferase